MKRSLTAVLAAAVLLATQVCPALAAAHTQGTTLIGCWPGTMWDEFGVPEITALSGR